MTNNDLRPALWRQAFRSLSAVTGLFAAVWTVTSGAVAQDAGYRSAATAPAAWQAFARQLQGRFEQRLAGDDKDARSFQEDMSKRVAEVDAPPLTFVARTWIQPDGRIERLEFDGLADKRIAERLRALLTRDTVDTPPSDMLQPLRLRLSLRPKEPAAESR